MILKQISFITIVLTSVLINRTMPSVSLDDMFPFGEYNSDSQLPIGDDGFREISFSNSEQFQFFNSTYSSLFINYNGAVCFGQGVSSYTPNCQSLSIPTIAPFWADINTSNGGIIHYRMSRDSEIITKAKREVARAFPNLRGLHIKWVFIITWDEVAFYGAVNREYACEGKGKRNTFQLILSNEGSRSFVQFNYNKVTWTTGTASNGDGCTGFGGTPAKAGFDLGDGKTFYTIPGSCSSEIVNVAETTNVGQKGKWIFRVDLGVDGGEYEAEERRKKANEEAKNLERKAEAKRLEDTRKLEEARRLAEEEEVRRLAEEEDARRLAEEEEARRLAKEKRKISDEARLWAEEKERKMQEEEARRKREITALLSKLYPFGSSYGDSRLPIGDDHFVEITLTRGHHFNFFNSSYSSFFINNNGGVSFTRGLPTFTPECLPQSTPMIMPFWADVDTTNGGSVLYRESNDPSVLSKATRVVRRAYPLLSSLHLDWLFIITWNDVSFFSARNSSFDCEGKSKRNTFQVILTTDGHHSFAIFNYDKVTWTTGGMSGGNHCTGLGGKAAKAGFDFGDSRTFFTLPGSCTNDILNVLETSNIGLRGRWLFRIDESLHSGDCQPIGGSMRRIKIEPLFISYFGGEIITLTSPCIGDMEMRAQCKFYDRTSYAIIVEGVMEEDAVLCRVPHLQSQGRITVELVLGDVTEFFGFVYSKRKKAGVKLSLGRSSDTFRMQWDPRIFSGLGRNYGLNLTLTVVEWDRNKPKWVENVVKYIDNSEVLRSGSYQDSKDLFRLHESHCYTYVQLVAVANSNHHLYLHLASEYFSNIHANSNEYARKCRRWYAEDMGPPVDVLPCPPRLIDAFVDQRFKNDANSKLVNIEKYHRGADFSFTQRIPGEFGGRQQCVYRRGTLLMGAPVGGTADLYSPRGSQGLLRHLMHDQLPWNWCCDKSDLCHLYYDKRPSDSGRLYRAPRAAIGKGDPHMTTFDLFSYTFNAVGEFWLVNATRPSNASGLRFSAQARMEQYINPETNRTTNASVFTAVAFEQRNLSSGLSTRVQISKMGNDTTRWVLMLDGEVLSQEDDDEDDLEMEENGVDLIVADDGFKLSFASGFTFSLIGKNGSLIISSGADNHTLKGAKIVGLLGNFDTIEDNDLITPEGQVVPSSSTLEQIHFNFGLKWRTNENDSIFTCEEGTSHSYYQKEDFLTSFEEPDVTLLSQEVLEACGSSKSCLFDYQNTGGNLAFALETLKAEVEFNKTVETIASSEEILVCDPPPFLEVPGQRYTFQNYLVGSELTFHCPDGEVPVGNNQFVCNRVTSNISEGGSVMAKWNITTLPTCRNETWDEFPTIPYGYYDYID